MEPPSTGPVDERVCTGELGDSGSEQVPRLVDCSGVVVGIVGAESLSWHFLNDVIICNPPWDGHVVSTFGFETIGPADQDGVVCLLGEDSDVVVTVLF